MVDKYSKAISAGGVVVRFVNGDMETILCNRKNNDLWCLPKGTPEDNETISQTALREVREETGLIVIIKSLIGDINYLFHRDQDNKNINKTVHYFLMEAIGGNISNHDHEFDEVHWIKFPLALQLMTYQNEVQILKKAHKGIA
jgi:8-oxo-dGTP pyrophosphatase MutT (NUDIX family)